MTHPPAMAYRPEIDGLRSIAVVAVILFHAGLSGLPGGYVGVDVFYVLSGYLITSLILRDQDKGDFSLVTFYQRRARRILPALLVMVAVTLAVGLAVFPPMQLQWLAQSALATGLFSANIYFMLKGGNYFAQDAFFPLKHAWSLGVEEQFYFLLPAALILAYRLAGHRGRVMVIWGGFILSLALMVLPSLIQGVTGGTPLPSGFYYNPGPRAWELLAGAILALEGRSAALSQAARATQKHDGPTALVGLALILTSVLLLDATTPFPSLWTVLPVIGTVLVIRHAVGSTQLARLLARTPFVAVGKISYSLYLWHYPVLTFAHYGEIDTTAPLPFLACIALITALSIASYRWIERPMRFAIVGAGRQKAVAGGLLTASLVLAGTGYGIELSGGLPMRGNFAGLPQDYFAHAGKLQRFTTGIDGRRCSEGCLALAPDGASETWLLVGDSHANDLRNEMRDAAEKAGVRLVYLIIASCVYSQSECPEGLTRWQEQVKTHQPTQIVFASGLAGKNPAIAYKLRADTATLLEQFLQAGTEITFFSRRPVFAEDPIRLALTGQMNRIALDPAWHLAAQNTQTDVTRLAQTYPGFHVIDQTNAMVEAGCGALSCFDDHDAHRLPLYRDTNHLTEHGAAVVFTAFSARKPIVAGDGG